MDSGIFRRFRPSAQSDRSALATSPEIAEVRAYWEALRHDGGIPERTAIDPRGISGALDRVFLADRIGPGLAQIRLSGSRVNEIAGMDARGLPLSCLFHPEARAGLGHILTHVFDGPMAADLELVAKPEVGRSELPARLVFLPLRGTTGTCSLLLGCLVTYDEIGRAPRRFEISRAVEERVAAVQSAEATRQQPALVNGHHLRLVYSAD